ncbi:MAG: GNAT family N-acetyltransferase [Lachnospiraceae bacterium]|nr:GNAT family N-acetyltransferase [Lachnospiraceae bacterium]
MYDVRFIDADEWEDAMSLAYRTFLEFDASYFTPEGVRHFREFISDNTLKRMSENGTFQVIGSYDGTKLIGVIALRSMSHISLLFVDSKYHNKGIGRKLISELVDYAKLKLHQDFLTVNAAPYAYDFYHKMGFLDMASEVTQDGIIYTPMKYTF